MASAWTRGCTLLSRDTGCRARRVLTVVENLGRLGGEHLEALIEVGDFLGIDW